MTFAPLRVSQPDFPSDTLKFLRFLPLTCTVIVFLAPSTVAMSDRSVRKTYVLRRAFEPTRYFLPDLPNTVSFTVDVIRIVELPGQ